MPQADLGYRISNMVKVSYSEEEAGEVEAMQDWELADKFSEEIASHMERAGFEIQVEDLFPLEEKTNE